MPRGDRNHAAALASAASAADPAAVTVELATSTATLVGSPVPPEEGRHAVLASALSASAAASIGLIVATGLGALREVVVARSLGVDGFGVVSLAEAAENLLIRVAPLGLTAGLPILLAQALARRDAGQAGRVLGSGLAIGAVLAIGSAALLFALSGPIAGLVGLPAAAPTLAIWALVVLGQTACQVIASALRGLLRIGLATAVRDVIPGVTVAGAAAAGAIAGLGVPAIAWAFAAGALAAALAAIAVLGRVASRDDLPLTLGEARPLLAYSIPVLTMVTAGQVIRQLNVPLLAVSGGATAVGLFAAAMFFGVAIEGIFTAVTLVAMPYASRLATSPGASDHLGNLVATLSRWTYAVTLGAGLIVAVAAAPLIGLILGPSYVGAADATRVVVLGLLVQAYLGPRSAVLLAIGRTRDVTVAFLVALVVALVVAVLGVPTLGIIAAAASFASALAVRSGLATWQLHRTGVGGEFGLREVGALLLVPGVALGTMLDAGSGPAGALVTVGATAGSVYLVFAHRLREDMAVARVLLRRDDARATAER